VHAGAAAATGGVVIVFTVPADAAPGKHSVVFSGAGFSCDPTSGDGFAVLGASATKKSSGGLSKTGIEVATYLAVALVLLLAGWQLLRMGRARRRRSARHHRSARRQPAGR
jgi:hypothetical protein